MNNYRIVIDPGHGGEDPGASGNGIIEKDLTLEISKYMYDRFKELGIPVYMTRTTDETLSPTERVNRILNAFGNNKNVIVVSNHINAGGGDGAEVIYALRNKSTLANKILNSLAESGQNIREVYQRRLPSDTSKDYYFIHRNTGNTEPVLVEYGFLDSKGDDVEQLKNNAEKYADAVVDAILDYIGYGTGVNYTVQKGDSLWSIANKFNISVEDLKSANNLTSNLLNIGQTLKIPSEESPVTGDYIVYIISKGDSLYSIAQKYNTTVNELIKYNNLSSTNLKIGEQLLIPTTESKINTYIVKSGDSLYSIAKKYGVTVDELKKANGLTSNNLNLNQKLVIPEAKGEIGYIVKSGDSLYSIAKKYNVTVDELKKANGLTTNTLSIGQELAIPETSETTTYTVKSGDSLYSIADKYGVSVANIKKANNLTSNLLSIGQILVIPK